MAIDATQQQRVGTIMNNVFGVHLRQVLLFGSYARGEQQEYSDKDAKPWVY